MRLRTSVGWSVPVLLAALAALGCHPGTIEDVSQLDLVVTWHDPEASFGGYLTYALEDTIYDLAELEDPEHVSDLERRFDAAILAQVAAELDAKGYARVDPDLVTPDLRVGVAASTEDGTVFYTSYPWWGYNPYYPWYPSVGSVDFTAGTIYLFMADWMNRDPEAESLAAIWMAAAQGVIESSESGMAARIERALSQMFTQSPYLGPSGEVTR